MEMKPSFRIPTFKSLCQFTCTLIFFINFTIAVSYSRTSSTSSSRIPSIPYSDKCASVVPEATPTTYETLTFPNLRPSSTYYTGGDRILGRNSFYFEKYLTFRTSPNVYATNISGVYKIEAVLTFRTYNTYHPSSNSTYGRSYYSRTRVGRLTFKLHGFWSESSGKACMVGFASWFSRKGDSLYLDAILKLYYAKNSASYTSLVSGKLESLRYPNDESYFEPISILAFPEINKYEYKLISEEIVRGFPGGIDIPKNLALGLHPGDFCSMFSTGFSTYKLEYASKCSSLRNCSPLDWGTGYMPHFISLYTIQCSEFGKNLRFLVEFTNSSYVGYRQMFDPNTTLVAEGSWDENRNQLCIVACRILNSTGSSLGNAHVGDCSFRLSLWYPAFLSIRNRTRSEGQIWTNKTATDVGYFDRITFRNSDYDMVGVPGLKYEYTELDKVRKLCSRKSVKKGETYPNGQSYDMRFDMTVKTSKGNFGWGYAVPIFIGNESFEKYPVAVSTSSSWGDYAEIAPEPAVEVNNAPLNVSYRISLSPEYDVKMGGGSSLSNLSLYPNGQVEISAEGVYDTGTGQVCMVGCRNVGSANDSLDCEILVNFQFPGSSGNNGGFIKGSIESTRKNSDPLFFEHLNMSSTAFSTAEAKQSIWRMDLEIIMVLISNTFACVFVGLQLYYVKKHPNVLPFISLVMLVILTLGHMIPLVLNFEALFLESHDRKNVLLGSSGWLEVNEVIVRVVTMVAFLLQFRLLQLAWTAHLSEGTEKGMWVAEKKGLFVTLPLYIVGGLIALFVNWRKNNYGNAVLTWSRGFAHQQQYSLWGNLRSYAGLILDGFLFPQILLNIFQMSREIALSPSFYLGTTSVRLVPHAYDLYRGHNYVPAHVNGTYIYANPNADFYSAAWDIIIPCAEILDFCDFLSPTPEEQASRNAAVECVFDVIKYIWPDCEVEVFGSFETGLYLPSSDIDVVIMRSNIRSPQVGLMALSRALSQRGVGKKIQVIAKARVPIIKFVEKRSGISFDISFDVHNGPKAAEFMKGAISKWPPLRPLCLILKVFLQQRELNEVYSGGIGSYALLAMLIAMLRSLNEFQAYPEHNLGVLLVNFFDIYGRKLNTSDVGVSCNGTGIFFFKNSKGFLIKGRPALISIEDPQAPDNDIGKNSFNYFQVRSAFAMAFSTLTNVKNIMALGPNRSILGTIIRPDPVLLERKGGCNGEVTFNNLLPGAGEPLQQEYNDQQGFYCNWQLDNEEESVTRAKSIGEDGSAQSSGMKRKVSKVKKLVKKLKDDGDVGVFRHEESASRNEKDVKKKRWRRSRHGFGKNDFGHHRGGGGSQLSRTC